MKNIFTTEVANEIINRINNLTHNSKPLWGKMSVDQMLAHCNVTYELEFTDKHPKPGPFKKFLFKTFIKNMVVSDKPF